MLPSLLPRFTRPALRAGRPSVTQEFEVESLERRELLAGNVTASMVHSDLVIKGDAFSNNVNIISIPTGIRVIGLPDPNGAATTVNGVPFVDFSGPSIVQDDVRIIMGKGRDRVGLFAAVNGDVTINLGANSDDVDVGTTIGGNLKIITGGADNLFPDFVDIVNTSVGGNTKVTGAAGSQQLFVANSAFFGSSVFTLGGGDDVMQVASSGFNHFRANGGGGRFDTFVAPFPATQPEVRGFEVFV